MRPHSIKRKVELKCLFLQNASIGSKLTALEIYKERKKKEKKNEKVDTIGFLIIPIYQDLSPKKKKRKKERKKEN